VVCPLVETVSLEEAGAMRVLIVGCGYVGLSLGKELARCGHEVYGVRRNAGASGGLSAAGIHPLIVDITRRGDLARLPAQFDWVVHCVAAGGGGAEDYRRTYLEGTRNVIEWLAATAPQKFVYTSSTSVYGQNDGSLVDENSATEPLAATAQVLIETEKLLLEAVRLKRIPAVILRVAGIYGPGRDRSVRQFLPNAAHSEGKGGRIMNLIHRDDVAGCIISALANGRPGEIYNAVDDEPVSQVNFFEWLAHQRGNGLPPAQPEAPEAGRRGITNKRVSNGKLKRELKYQFKYPNFRSGYLAGMIRTFDPEQSETRPGVD
jgi:nucleoside-diphosphate-sugar epimerase